MRQIDADALLVVPNVRKVTEYDESGCGVDYNAVPVEAIETAPTIDAEPVRHGRWIDRGDYITTAYGRLDLKICSNCNAEVTLDGYDDYRPNCGAKMNMGEKDGE